MFKAKNRALLPVIVAFVIVSSLGIIWISGGRTSESTKSSANDLSAYMSNKDITFYCSRAGSFLKEYPGAAYWTWVLSTCNSSADLSSLYLGESKGITMMCAYAQHLKTIKATMNSQEVTFADNCTKPTVLPPSPNNEIVNNLQPGMALGIYDNNAWIGQVNGALVTVFAGISGSQDGVYSGDSTTGKVITYSHETQAIVASATLLNSGPFIVTSVNGTNATIQSSSGTTYTYGIDSGALNRN